MEIFFHSSICLSILPVNSIPILYNSDVSLVTANLICISGNTTGMRHLKIISYRGTISLVIRLGYLVPICVLCKTCWIYDLIHSYPHIGDRWDTEVDLSYRMSFRSPMGACRSPLKRILPGSCPLCAVVRCSMQKLQDWVDDSIFGYVFVFRRRRRLLLSSKSSSEWMHGVRRLCHCWKHS